MSAFRRSGDTIETWSNLVCLKFVSVSAKCKALARINNKFVLSSEFVIQYFLVFTYTRENSMNILNIAKSF